jgi:hypothetical protein
MKWLLLVLPSDWAYLVGSFVAASFDISVWGVFDRALLAFCATGATVIMGIEVVSSSERV